MFVSLDLYLSAPHHKRSVVPGELLSMFTISETPYIQSRLCDANVKISLQIMYYGKSV